MPNEDARRLLQDAVRDAEGFQQLVLTDIAASDDRPAYRKVALRRSALRDDDRFELDLYTDCQHRRRHVTLHEVLAIIKWPFVRAHLQRTIGDVHIRVTRKGRTLISKGKPSRPAGAAPRPHDRRKRHILPADEPNVLLVALGIQTRAGKLRSGQTGKFHQINQFLDILLKLDVVCIGDGPLTIVDCGCGAAYLTFAAHSVLRDQHKRDVETFGVDVNATLIDQCRQLATQLDCRGIQFAAERIADFSPPRRPDLVMSLHACDTATDEALAQGVRWQARAILAAPCCQHELREQIQHDGMTALLRHGVLKSRQADLVTDAARAALLRLHGYRCDVIEFVSPEHTGKNVLLRAVRRSNQPLPGAAEEYAALKSAWRIDPALERMLA